MSDTSVRVAVRVRPQLAKERIDMCQICTFVTPGEPQIVIGKDKAFTFDYVFDLNCEQEHIYNTCAKELIEGTFDGYNATIFAYGQTGSGKTYSMGTGFDVNVDRDVVGIIPRAVEHLFHGIDERRQEAVNAGRPLPDFSIKAQFIELYNEEILDLLDTTRDPSLKGRKSHVRIHEDASGSIYTVGITTRIVQSVIDAMQCLKMGALCRTTASTNMNTQSSRSHAIFTLHIRQQRIALAEMNSSSERDTNSADSLTDFEVLTAKFHFVDLAGSERLKRTGATGRRAKESISINCGLLALGNVISALGDKAKKGLHVPYRDSKLTRLLQDSLGGNSRTVMISCISPSDRDFMETLNTLKYANRARNIKNRVVVNQDKASQQLAKLRAELQAVQAELLEYKAGMKSADASVLSDASAEIAMLQSERKTLRLRIRTLQDTVDTMSARNAQLLADLQASNIVDTAGDSVMEEAKRYIHSYITENEDLRKRLAEAEATVAALRRPSSRSVHQSTSLLQASSVTDDSVALDDQYTLGAAKKGLKKLRDQLDQDVPMKGKKSACNGSDGEKKDGNDLDDSIAMAADLHEADDLSGDEDDVSDYGAELDDNDDANDADADDDDDDAGSDVDARGGNSFTNLTTDIASMANMVAQLKRSEREKNVMKIQYEEKLAQQQQKIRETENERDRVLASLGNAETQSQEKANHIRADYEKRLNAMQVELRKLEAAKMEHLKLLRNQSHTAKQLKTFEHDLFEMKKMKVQLMSKIRDETIKGRQAELKHNQELIQLRKEQRIKDSQIRSLEADKRQKEVILRRKQEEVESLRRSQAPQMSAKVAGRVGKYDRSPTVPVSPVSNASSHRYTSTTASNSKRHKVIWDDLEKSLSAVVSKKQTMARIERDMERWIKERETLGKKVEKYSKKKEKILSTSAEGMDNSQLVKEIGEQIESLRDSIGWAHDNINECQTNIVHLEESKYDEIEPLTLLERCSLSETKYLLERCIGLIISKGLLAAEREDEVKELVAKLHHERMDGIWKGDMLQHLIQQQSDIRPDDVVLNNDVNDDSDSDASDDSASDNLSPVDSMAAVSAACVAKIFIDEMIKEKPLISPVSHIQPASSAAVDVSVSNMGDGKREKARRKTATAEDLLFAGASDGSHLSAAAVSPVVISTRAACVVEPAVNPPLIPARSAAAVEQGGSPPERDYSLVPVTKPASSRVNRPDSLLYKSEVSTVVSDKRSLTSVRPVAHTRDTSPALLRHKEMSQSVSSADSASSLTRVGSVSSSDTNNSLEAAVSNSPQVGRRAKEQRGNVFSRLTSQMQSSSHPSRGVINSVASKGTSNCPIAHCYTAVGHSKAVLSLFAVDDLLFTGSKDRTCKIWDLSSNEEILTLDGHPNNVVGVQYAEMTSLIHTVSAYVIKVWDPRRGNVCIKTLTSAGLTVEGGATGNSNVPRQVTCPPGETAVSDMALSSTGEIMYSAAGNTVRIWDLRTYKSVGKLSSGHQAAIMKLAIDDTDTADGNICIVTGAKDHYVKVFEVMEDSVGVFGPKYNLEPPHYDGIQSLCLMGDLLFTGSRDTCIKKWDLAEQQQQHMINKAHDDWVTGLVLNPGSNHLLSCCRGGLLKVWNIDNCSLVGDVHAHNSPVNALATNSKLLFAASNDKTVSCWKSNDGDIDIDSCDD